MEAVGACGLAISSRKLGWADAGPTPDDLIPIFQPNLTAGAGRRWIFLCAGLHRLELLSNTSPTTSTCKKA